MFRFFALLTYREWLVVIGGLSVVIGLEIAKPNSTAQPTPPDALAALPPSPSELPQTPYHLRSETEPSTPSQTAPLPAIGPVQTFGPETLIRQTDNGDLGLMAVAALKGEFSRGGYFGAFFGSADNQSFGWSTGYASRDAARTAALARCQKDQPDCRLIAELLPSDAPDEMAENSLSHAQAQGYFAIQSQSGPRAFARSVDGTWASEQADDVGKATSAAIGQCEISRRVTPGLPRMPCEVIAVWTD